MLTDEFLILFTNGFDDGFLQYGVGSPTDQQYVPLSEVRELALRLPRNTDVYFGPAIRTEEGALKENVRGTRYLWADFDTETLPDLLVPASIIVSSGHGFHVYWRLDSVETNISLIEKSNKGLGGAASSSADSAWNVNRVLRVPNSINSKDPKAPVRVLRTNQNVYSARDIRPFVELSRKTIHKIITGDRRGYKSRSERDWAVVTELLRAGFDDDGIIHIFSQYKVGSKYREAGEQYLIHTIEKAKESPKAITSNDGSSNEIQERLDGYYIIQRRGSKRISTFTFDPEVLIDGSVFDAMDALGGKVKASGFEWPDETFTREAFTTLRNFDKESPKMAWQWLGNENDLRMLLPFLMEKLKAKGDGSDFPRIMGTQTLGMHYWKAKWYFVGDEHVIGSEQIWEGQSGPVAWVPTKREHPVMCLGVVDPNSFVRMASEVWPLIQDLNTHDNVFTFLGWYSSALIKPWLETEGYRFPTLNVTGMRGSGKTTLIQRVFMPLFGQKEPKSYDAGTTRFVTLALLGSSNSVPIAFSEFRYAAVEKFLRFVLLSYDTGHDPRGRADQSTVDYPLSAPFSLDGEDLVVDPAAQQRLNVVRLLPKVVEEGSPAHQAFGRLRSKLPDHKTFAATYIQWLVTEAERGGLRKRLESAKGMVKKAFPQKMPDRVRRNHIVNYFGVMSFCDAIGVEVPDASYLDTSIRAVFDIESGRARSLGDEFIEDVINQCANSVPKFKWSYSNNTKTVWFQLSTAHNWWLSVRRSRGRGTLERDAIADQVSHSEYYRGREVRERTWMYGVSLPIAQRVGLDVPTELNKVLTLSLD